VHFIYDLSNIPTHAMATNFRNISTLNLCYLSSDKRRGGSGVVLVVEMGGGDAGSSLADVVAGVADGADLGGGDGAKGLAALGVTEDDDCGG
jgi:hypothetical protein